VVLSAFVTSVPISPALAGGGSGGAGDAGFTGSGGGAGGADGQPGGDGGIGIGVSGGGGGGGGGAGGGIGGTGAVGTSGTALTTPGGTAGNPGTSTSASASASGGGGGGDGGANGQSSSQISNAAALAGATGGNGGAGGDTSGANSDAGGGGGGGSGGHGLLITGATINSNTSTITGGNGGNGGRGGNVTDPGTFASGNGGNGGDGGNGVQVSTQGATLTNSGTIQGGNGGTGGAGGTGGSVPGRAGGGGAGGAGVSSAGLTLINSGSIAGGLANGGAGARANAISFTGGTNVLEIQVGSAITGNVVAFSTADTLRLGGTTNSIFDLSQLGPAAQYQGFGILAKSGSSTWTVSNAPGTTMAWQVNAGTLDLNTTTQTASSFLLTGGTLTNGTLSSSGTFAVEAGSVSAVLTGTGGVSKTTSGTVTLSAVNTYTGTTTIDGGLLTVTSTGGITSSVAVSAGQFTDAGLVTGNVTSNAGTVLVDTGGTWTGNVTANNSTVTNNGTWGGDVTANASTGTITDNHIWNGNVTSNAGAIINASVATWTGAVNGNASIITNNGIWAGTVAANASTGTITNNLTWNGDVTSNAGTIINASVATWTGAVNGNSNVLTNNGIWAGAVGANDSTGTITNNLTWNGAVTSNAGTIINASVATWTGAVNGNSNVLTNNGIWAGNVAANASTGTITNNKTWNGAVTTNAGTVINAAVATWTGAVNGNSGIITNNGVWAGNVVSNAGTITNNKTWTGTVSNAGTFNNNAGAAVSGLLTNTAGVTTDNGALNGGATVTGGTLTGTGSVTTLTMSGGIFAPGNGTPGSSMTVSGSLAFQSGAFYLVQLNPTTSSLANVTGNATLGGATVNAMFANGTYVARQYTILTAGGGVSGTFGSVVNTNLPSGFKTALSYDAKDAFLNLTLNFTPPSAPNFGGGLSGNQQGVGNAITNFFNSNGSIPLVFGGLTPAGLTQVSGETVTGSQQTTFDAMTQFMGVMTDPFIGGRGDSTMAGSSATPFADEIDAANAYAARDPARSKSERDAYAAIYRKAPAMAAPFVPGWSVWAAGFGGSQTTNGNTTLGSNSTTSSLAGTAVGADYRFSPFTIAGFALAGGGTGFSVANGGSGHSDLFQAGAFIRHTVGQAYITGALAYGWQDITTNRTVSVAGIDQLRAQFNANVFSGRIEGGYRFVSPWMGVGITPYAAGQFTTFNLPAYAEQVIVGTNNFALAFGAKSVTDPRSELGIRTDKSFAMPDGVLTLRGRLAWAHDFDTDRSIGATFQSLPGASFVVNGAAQASDSVLTTASIERRWTNNWSVAATFEGEFSNVTSSYAGKGVVRYAW
jgi:uncharacterized protein with beta-barrel porin domain